MQLSGNIIPSGVQVYKNNLPAKYKLWSSACKLFSQPNGPATPVDMAVDYYKYDYEFAEPPRVTSLQNTVPLPTFKDFGDDVYFVADQRGYESVVYYVPRRPVPQDQQVRQNHWSPVKAQQGAYCQLAGFAYLICIFFPSCNS